MEFSILVYKLIYDENGKLVVTTETIPTGWNNKYTTIEGSTVTIKPGASTLTITGAGTQTSSLPGTLPMPSCPGLGLRCRPVRSVRRVQHRWSWR